MITEKSNITTSVKHYTGLDTLKLILSLCVLALHTGFPQELGPTLYFAIKEGFFRISVPCFFIISGFLYEKKSQIPNFNLFKYLKRLIIMYLCWVIVYMPISIYDRVLYNSEFVMTIPIFIKDIIAGFYWQMWFYPASILSILLYHTLKKRINGKIIVIFALLCHIFGILGDGYAGIGLKIPVINTLIYKHYANWGATNNFLFTGLIFIIIGSYLAKKEEFFIKYYDMKKLLLIFTACCTLMLIEVFLIKHYQLSNLYQQYIFNAVSSVPLFLIFRGISIDEKYKPIVQRQISTLIFSTHTLAMFLLRLVNYNNLLTIGGKVIYLPLGKTYAYFGYTLLLTTILSFLILILSKTKPFKFLKNFY